MKILAIVPAFNEELNILNVIQQLKSIPQLDIVVINDASKDKTSLLSHQQKVTTLDLPCNLGIGAAVQTGYIYAWENQYDIAIQFDGDGQHQASYIPKLIQTLVNSSSDMVIGSRFISQEGFQSTFLRRIGITYFSLLLYLILKQKITDPTSGFRAVNRKLIRLFVQYYPDDYPEPEVLVYLHRKNIKILEIPVLMQKRSHGFSSIKTFHSIYYVFKVSLSILINLIRF